MKKQLRALYQDGMCDNPCRALRIVSRVLVLALGIPLCLAQVPGDSSYHPEMKSLVAHTSWTIRDGAPGNITALAQTPDGYLWLGTPLGLYRFDGTQFTSYPTTTLELPLPSVDIEALSSDAKGGLWIGYHFGGISHLTHNGLIANYNQRNGLGPNSVQKFVVRDDGSVWALGDNRLLVLRGEHWEDFGAAHGLPVDQMLSLFFDSKGNIWTSARQKLFVLRNGESKFSLYPTKSFMIVDIAEMPDGRLWVSDGWHSIHQLDPASELRSIPTYGYVRILVEPNGMLWMAQDYRGVSHLPFSPAEGLLAKVEKEPELTSQQTNAIMRDMAGNVWVGTSRGLDRLRLSPIETLAGMRLEYYPALASDPTNGVWIGALAHPILHANGDSITDVGPVVGSSPMICDENGVVWLVDPIENALTRIDHGKVERIAIPIEVRAGAAQTMGLDRDGTLLVSFDEAGLWHYDGRWSRVHDPALPFDYPLAIYRDANHTVWLGYANSIIVSHDAKGYHTLSEGSAGSLGNVLTFATAQKRIWAAGTAGLTYFDQGVFHKVSMKHGDVIRGISGIVMDKSGDMWLNSSTGIARVSAPELDNAVLHHAPAEYEMLNDRQGLVGTATQLKPTPSAASDSNGQLWFSTSGAVFSISPAKISISRSMPMVALENVSVDGVSLLDREHGGDGIAVRANLLKDLEIDYIGIDLASPEKVSYRYMLQGQDKDWRDVGNRRQAFYNYLGPGKYSFRVQASTGQGRWIELAMPLRLIVTPAFYQTWWFYAFCAFPILGLLYLGYLWRIHRVTSRLRERLKERAEERVRIARELHDTLLQSVHGLMLRFHFATEQLESNEPARDSLRLALSRADEVLLEGRRRVQDLREEVPDATDLAGQIAKAAETMDLHAALSFNIVESGTRTVLAPRVQVEVCRIAKEALANSLHHSDATSATVVLTYGGSDFTLECSDDGKGLPASILSSGRLAGHWGLVGMRERAASVKGKLELWSSPGNGTKITVRIPSHTAYGNRRTKFIWLNRFLQLRRDATGNTSSNDSY